MTTNKDVVENHSAPKGTVKINVSPQVKKRLLQIQEIDGHTTMDSVVRSLLALVEVKR